jgi:hypothetical protein
MRALNLFVTTEFNLERTGMVFCGLPEREHPVILTGIQHFKRLTVSNEPNYPWANNLGE